MSRRMQNGDPSRYPNSAVNGGVDGLQRVERGEIALLIMKCEMNQAARPFPSRSGSAGAERTPEGFREGSRE
jgi:hypothetical protein